jgi:hypothetical protein
VRPIEHNTKTPSVQTGLFALLAGLFDGRGKGAPTRLLGVVVATGVILALRVVPALAAESLQLRSGLGAAPAVSALVVNKLQIQPLLAREEVYATRAHLDAEIDIGNALEELEWRGEYATSEALLGEGKGTPAGNSKNHEGEFALGIKDATAPNSELQYNVLHYLSPNTTYYVRLHVKNPSGDAAERTFEFRTLAISKPEIPHQQVVGIIGIGGETPSTFRQNGSPTLTTLGVTAQVESNGAETKYSYEYSTAKSGGYVPAPGCSGVVSVAEDFANPECEITGLAPETTYYIRLKLTNEKGSVEEVLPLETHVAKPVVGDELGIRNITGIAAHIVGNIETNGSETDWRFEYATSATSSWTTFASGVISATEAAEPLSSIEADLTGLKPSTVYYVRVFAKNAAGEGIACYQEVTKIEGIQVCELSTGPHVVSSFETTGLPVATTFAAHALNGEALRLLGAVNPNSVPTSAEQTVTIEGVPTGGTFTLSFKGQTTAPIVFDASAANGPGSVKSALAALPDSPEVNVTGPAGGPYTVSFFGSDGGVAEPAIIADGSGLTPSGSVTVVVGNPGGVGSEAGYRFQYVSQQQFEAPGGEGGFARASVTPEVDLGAGANTRFVGADLPALVAGETYRYRIVVSSSIPGSAAVDGEERTLTVPTASAAPTAPAGCPNESLRGGASAGLPDCRGYEQLTPVDKEGAQEIFQYGLVGLVTTPVVGEGGGHFALETNTSWGPGPGAGQSPYFFSREADGWKMSAGSPQPATGINRLQPKLYSSDLKQVALESEVVTGVGAAEESSEIEIEDQVGPAGGPYTLVASVPHSDRGDIQSESGWVAASPSFSKLVLQTGDHTLLGASTETKSGEDLYEYSAGQLRQANVDSAGQTIGSCGANIVKGAEKQDRFDAGSVHAVSADGSRVFFEAVPTGGKCSDPKHLYMRVDGGSEEAQTVDLGAYRFAAANPQGTEVLLAKESGGENDEPFRNDEFFLYDTESQATPTFAFKALFADVDVSQEFTAVYFRSHERPLPEAPAPSAQEDPSRFDLYRYDIPAETLSFIAATEEVNFANGVDDPSTSPDGRYYYFRAVALNYPGGARETEQAYRYDNVEKVIQCISCASSFDQEPKQSAFFASHPGDPVKEELISASANGDFVFFDTPAALVPQDVDGEVPPEGNNTDLENASLEYSPSSDVYEWRRDGLDGCAQVQGCLALITSGRGGVLNMLLGVADEGQEAFVYTKSQLVPQDNDTEGDVYDVRVGGGTPPPPPRPVECEGDACSTPFAAPNDATPSSSTFHGAGDTPGEAAKPAAAKTKKPKAKRKAVKKKQKGKRRSKSRGKKSSKGAVKAYRAGNDRGAKR